MQFTRKLQTLIFNFSLVPAILIMVLSALVFSLMFRPFVHRTLSYDADLFANRVLGAIHDEFGLLEFIRDLPVTRNMLSNPLDDKSSIRSILDEHLALQVASHDELEALYVEDAGRTVIASNDPLFPPLAPLAYVPKDLQRNFVSPVMRKPTSDFGDVSMLLGTPVFGESGRRGIVIGIFNLSRLRSIAQEDRMFESTFRLVIQTDGSILASSSEESFYWTINDFSSRSNLPSKVAMLDPDASPSGSFTFLLDDAPYTARYRYLPELGWIACTSIANGEFLKPALGMLPLYVIFCALFIGALSIAIHRMAALVSRPVQALVNGMEHVRRNDYRYRMPTEGSGDLLPMLEAFNTLMDHVARDTEQLKRLNHELDVLTANIPGGLFTCALDQDLPFLNANEPFALLHGHADRTLLKAETGNSFLLVIHEDDRAFIRRLILSAAEGDMHGSCEYRIRSGDHPRWISCTYRIIPAPEHADAPAVLFGMVVDATEKHEAFELLRTSDERYRILLDQTDEVIFEWSLANKEFLFTSREKTWIRMFGRPIPGNTDLLGGDILGMHGDDRSRFATHMRELAAGKLKSTRIEVRLMREEPQGTRMIWTRFLLTSILDSHGEVSRVAGRIQDIHEEKTESLRLLGLSQTDGLTSLMNRRGFEAGVTRLLAVTEGTSKCHVLCMLDVDDFKQINDTRGHAFGDRVLVRIATLLKETFRETDLYGRLGGDEFAVFLVNFSDVRALPAKIDVLVSKLHAEQIQCSMGIACHPQDGTTFPSLYGKADEALYRVKKGGKDGYAFSG